MKRVLVIGAAGGVGLNVIKYLLSEGKYEITALDLRTKNSVKALKKYRRRMNIIYGDINDSVLIDALVRDQDYIIHLAGILPPLANMKQGLSDLVEYKGTENLIKALNYYNPNCMVLYASTTSIYGNVKEPSVKTKSKIDEEDYYSKTKRKIEKLISSKVKNYSIIRLPFILSNPKTSSFFYHVNRNTKMEVVTDHDAGYLFVSAIANSDKLNGKLWNAGGGDVLTLSYREILSNVLSIYGISFRYLFTTLFIDKNFYGHVYQDSDELNDILDFRSDSLASYLMRLKRNTKRRQIQIILAKPIVWLLNRKMKKER